MFTDLGFLDCMGFHKYESRKERKGKDGDMYIRIYYWIDANVLTASTEDKKEHNAH